VRFKLLFKMKARRTSAARRPGHRTPAPIPFDRTRGKLLDAAGKVFAERGYEAATVREICRRAGANVAAVNYHFRDKLGLYTEVLNQLKHAAHVGQMEMAFDQKAAPEQILRDVIRARVRGLRGDNKPDWHFRIMARELSNPTPALAGIIKKTSQPLYKRMLETVSEITGLSPRGETATLCVNSVIGQILFYVFAGPMLVQIYPEKRTKSPEQLDRLADHIADFSLAYLRQIRKHGARVTVIAARAKDRP
jgi:AcrR family transcriptional regulator